MRCRSRSLAANAACVAFVRVSDARGAAGDNTYRQLCRGADDGHDGFAAIQRPPPIIAASNGSRREAEVIAQLNNNVPAKTIPALMIPGSSAGNTAYCSQTTNR